ncbi:nuclear transport factor 2 family protein [Pacificimonas sp. ICDLI1SI03]
MDDLELRIARLEAESEIRKLKARYLNACDAKNVDAIRACFVPDAKLVFPPIGEFGVDGLIEVFTQMAAETPIVDTHHGHNAEIDIAGDAKSASARWNLGFATYDPRNKAFRLLSNFYTDRYVLTDDGWRITYSESHPRSIVDGVLGDDAVTAGWVDA